MIGGSGDYFEVADSVVMMDSYLPKDVTKRAKQIAMDTQAAPSSSPEKKIGSSFAEIYDPTTAARMVSPDSIYKLGDRTKTFSLTKFVRLL